MPIEYDVVIIGATELGCRMARRAAYMGARVALVEQLVTPESSLRYRVMVRSQLPKLESQADRISWLDLTVQDECSELSVESLQIAGVDYIANAGAFIQRPVQGFQVETRLLRSSRYVSALQGDRTVPLGLSNVDWVTPENVVTQWFELKDRRVAIVGEMPVGVELAMALRSQGAEVLLVVPTEQVLPKLDRMFGDRVQMALEVAGVEVLVNTSCDDRSIRNRISDYDTIVLATPIAKLLPERLGLRSLNGVMAKQHRLRMVGSSDLLTANVEAIAISIVDQVLMPWKSRGVGGEAGCLAGLDAAWVDSPKSLVRRGRLSLEGVSLEEGRLWYRVEVGTRGEILGAYFVGDRSQDWAGIFSVAIAAKMRLSNLLQLALPNTSQNLLASRWFREWEMQARSPLLHEFFLDWLGFVRRRSK